MTHLSVTWLHLYIYMQCIFPFIYYSWHGTINSQTTGKHLQRDNLCCIRASRASEENFSISTFQTCYFFHYFCRYNMPFNSQGDDNTGHPPTSNIGGGGGVDISPHPPPPPGIDTHDHRCRFVFTIGGMIGVLCEGAKRPSRGRVWEGGRDFFSHKIRVSKSHFRAFINDF